jgi:hypothetical protein
MSQGAQVVNSIVVRGCIFPSEEQGPLPEDHNGNKAQRQWLGLLLGLLLATCVDCQVGLKAPSLGLLNQVIFTTSSPTP